MIKNMFLQIFPFFQPLLSKHPVLGATTSSHMKYLESQKLDPGLPHSTTTELHPPTSVCCDRSDKFEQMISQKQCYTISPCVSHLIPYQCCTKLSCVSHLISFCYGIGHGQILIGDFFSIQIYLTAKTMATRAQCACAQTACIIYHETLSNCSRFTGVTLDSIVLNIF